MTDFNIQVRIISNNSQVIVEARPTLFHPSLQLLPPHIPTPHHHHLRPTHPPWPSVCNGLQFSRSVVPNPPYHPHQKNNLSISRKINYDFCKHNQMKRAEWEKIQNFAVCKTFLNERDLSYKSTFVDTRNVRKRYRWVTCCGRKWWSTWGVEWTADSWTSFYRKERKGAKLFVKIWKCDNTEQIICINWDVNSAQIA